MVFATVSARCLLGGGADTVEALRAAAGNVVQILPIRGHLLRTIPLVNNNQTTFYASGYYNSLTRKPMIA